MDKAVFVFWGIALATKTLEIAAGRGGLVYLELKSLENLQNKNYLDRCCDGSVQKICEPCDYQFEVWVSCDAKRNDSSCPHGYSRTGTFSKTNNVIFNNTLGNGLHNPLVYNFTLFWGTIGIQILAVDYNGSKIDDYRFHVPYYPNIYHKQKWKNTTLTAIGLSNSKLVLNYTVFCNEHYYAASCTVGCPPGKTYTCNVKTGAKLCNAEWLGPYCNCTRSLQNTCDISTGKKICYRPWHGDNCDIQCTAKNNSLAGYTCDKSTGQKMCRSGWYGTECNHTTQVLPTSINIKYLPRTLSCSTLCHMAFSVSTSQSTSPPTSPPTSRPTSQLTSPTRSPRTSQPIMPLSPSPMTSHLINTWARTKTAAYKTTQAVSKNLLPSERTSVEQQVGTSVKIGDQTEQLNSPPKTSTLGLSLNIASHTELKSQIETISASKACNVTQTALSSTITYNLGSTEARKRHKELWWIMLLTLTTLALLTVAGFLALRHKMRKHSEIQAKHEIPLDIVQEPDIHCI